MIQLNFDELVLGGPPGQDFRILVVQNEIALVRHYSENRMAETLLIEKGISFGMCDLVVVEMKDGPSMLGACLRELQEAETNVYFCYPLMIQASNCCALAFRLDDTEFGITALQNCGFKVLFQNDLSR